MLWIVEEGIQQTDLGEQRALIPIDVFMGDLAFLDSGCGNDFVPVSRRRDWFDVLVELSHGRPRRKLSNGG